MKDNISGTERKIDSAAGPTQLFVEELAQFCSLAGVPEEAAIATIRAAYRRQPSAAVPQPTGFVDSLGASQVLSAWHEHGRFLDGDGMPAALSLSKGQFRKLCQTAAIKSNSDDVLNLLVESGAVRQDGDMVAATRRHLIVGENRPAGVARAIRTVQGLLSTVNHNLTRAPDEPGRFERSVANRRLSARQIPALLAHLNIHGESFLEDLDSWMSARESDDAPATIGVAVYLYVDAAYGEPATSRRKPQKIS